jgi:hypothetical protein
MGEPSPVAFSALLWLSLANPMEKVWLKLYRELLYNHPAVRIGRHSTSCRGMARSIYRRSPGPPSFRELLTLINLFRTECEDEPFPDY